MGAGRYSASSFMGVPPRGYDSYWGEDQWDSPVINSLNGGEIPPRPQMIGGGADPMMLTQYNPLRERAKDVVFNQATSALEAEEDIQGGDTDWTSPQGISKLQDFIAKGVIHPSQARAIMSIVPRGTTASRAASTNKYTPPPPSVATAAARLRAIDPNDPDAMIKLQRVADPNVTDPMTQAHPLFDSEYRNLQKAINTAARQREISGRKSPDDEAINDALKAGVMPDELEPYLDENKRVKDRIGLRAATYQAMRNQAVLGTGAAKRLEELGYKASIAPSVPEKQMWIESHYPQAKDNPTDAMWSEAYNAIKESKQKEYRAYLEFLRSQGYKKLPGAAQAQAPAATPSPAAAIPTFRTVQEAEAAGLSPGTHVVIGGRPAVIE